MPKLIFLGTASAVPDEKHENSHMIVVARKRILMIDCVNTPTVRLPQAGIDPLAVTDLLLTHFHPDHVSGVPSFLMSSWLTGRKQELKIYGLAYTLDRMERLMDAYDWQSWPDFFPVHFIRLPDREMSPVFKDDELHVFSSPVKHLVPTIGLRIEFCETDKVLAYSCDTEPCPQVVTLGAGADVLVHEASGATIGHSSAEQAGAIAREAEAGQLYLTHYPPNGATTPTLVENAQQTFLGPVTLAQDFMTIEF